MPEIDYFVKLTLVESGTRDPGGNDRTVHVDSFPSTAVVNEDTSAQDGSGRNRSSCMPPSTAIEVPVVDPESGEAR